MGEAGEKRRLVAGMAWAASRTPEHKVVVEICLSAAAVADKSAVIYAPEPQRPYDYRREKYLFHTVKHHALFEMAGKTSVGFERLVQRCSLGNCRIWPCPKRGQSTTRIRSAESRRFWNLAQSPGPDIIDVAVNRNVARH